MLVLQAKFLAASELDARDPYPPSFLVTLLDGEDTIRLVTDRETFDQLEGTEQFADLFCELRWRKFTLPSDGQERGKAYKLRLIRLLDPEVIR